MSFNPNTFIVLLNLSTMTADITLDGKTTTSEPFNHGAFANHIDEWQDMDINGDIYDVHYLDDEDGINITIYGTYMDNGFLATNTNECHVVQLTINQ